MRAFLLAGGVLFGASAAAAQDSVRMGFHPADGIQWKEGPASLPKGTPMAILEGDPTQPGVAGSFGYWVAGTPHFAWFENETVLRLHGRGPWTITYVNPADDPRKSAP